MCACVCACVRACVRACVCMRVCVMLNDFHTRSIKSQKWLTKNVDFNLTKQNMPNANFNLTKQNMPSFFSGNSFLKQQTNNTR